MVKCSEKSSKEQDFRNNEKNHPVAEAFLDGWGMVSLESTLSDDISSSLIYRKYVSC